MEDPAVKLRIAQEGKMAPADQLEKLAKKSQMLIGEYPQSDLLPADVYAIGPNLRLFKRF